MKLYIVLQFLGFVFGQHRACHFAWLAFLFYTLLYACSCVSMNGLSLKVFASDKLLLILQISKCQGMKDLFKVTFYFIYILKKLDNQLIGILLEIVGKGLRI